MEQVRNVYDYGKLMGLIKERYGTQEQFAEMLGLGRVSLSQRLNNKLEFRQSEIKSMIDLLEIPKEQIVSYFFMVVSTQKIKM